MTERDWLDEIEASLDKCFGDCADDCPWPAHRRLIAEVRRLRWFEENFERGLWDDDNDCLYCEAHDHKAHYKGCEYVAHTAPAEVK